MAKCRLAYRRSQAMQSQPVPFASNSGQFDDLPRRQMLSLALASPPPLPALPFNLFDSLPSSPRAQTVTHSCAELHGIAQPLLSTLPSVPAPFSPRQRGPESPFLPSPFVSLLLAPVSYSTTPHSFNPACCAAAPVPIPYAGTHLPGPSPLYTHSADAGTHPPAPRHAWVRPPKQDAHTSLPASLPLLPQPPILTPRRTFRHNVSNCTDRKSVV